MKKIDAALEYASWGWWVFPLLPNAKIPATLHGFKDATTDKEKIKKWWEKNPELNIGGVSGKESVLIVFDIDPRNGGEEDWAQWLDENEGKLNGMMQLTAGGGYHYLCEYDERIRTCKLTDGIDLLSDGHYFVVSPSVVNNKSYEWELSSSPFDGVAPSVIPNSWIEKITNNKKEKSEQSSGLIQGNRNTGLTSLAGAMRNYGMTESEILAAISVANETRCEIPLPSSEIRQIAKSVSRYEPETDIAANAAIGDKVANELLSGKSNNRDYFFTRATSFLNQPSPIPWLVKGWLPQYATMMMYGESGVGKTFVALDLACCIVSGVPWHEHKVKQSPVIYLAGEGNYGLRQRLASWAKYNKNSSIENLLISNKQISMDLPGAAESILSALSDIDCENPGLIIVDTINAHMNGDENSAKDTRQMLNACNVVAAVTQSAVLLIHHIGHAETAKNRARGSSAWKAALDAQIGLRRVKSGGVKVECTKMKDAPEPPSMLGILEPVDLGWKDADGINQPGMVFRRMTEEEAKNTTVKKETKLDNYKKIFELSWYATHCETRKDKVYVSRSGLIDYLVNGRGMKERTAQDSVKPTGRIVGALLNANYVVPHEYGWLLNDDGTNSALMLKLNV